MVASSQVDLKIISEEQAQKNAQFVRTVSSAAELCVQSLWAGHSAAYFCVA
jgi:hypothetical protein